jgi:hypothetical protein
MSFVLFQLEMSVKGHGMKQLDTSLELLPVREYRLQVGVTRTPVSSTSPNWDLDVLYQHSAARSKYRLAGELTIHRAYKASSVGWHD